MLLEVDDAGTAALIGVSKVVTAAGTNKPLQTTDGRGGITEPIYPKTADMIEKEFAFT